ncbi:SMEK domain-containing protein [Marinomonas sp.]|uniref:SMEK domain-containing protein n=1 Tax=Marinomonas sp. TaxID=1904862 RepID=UPI003BAB03EE
MYLSKDRIIDSISEQLINLSKFVLIKNQMGFTDINSGAEDFFCNLLNMIYGLQLRNMNDLKSNYPAIDLGDKQSRVCFQVTSENTKNKVERTIKKFVDNQLDRDYDWLVFLIISDKNKPKIEKKENFGVDVVDVKGLISQISGIQDINLIEKINQYLAQNLRTSAPVTNSILPTNITQAHLGLKYESFIGSFNLNPLNESDNEYKNLLINALDALQNIFMGLSQPEREYIYFVISNGRLPERGSGFYNDTLLIPSSKLDLHLSKNTAFEIYKSLSLSNLVNYIADYQPHSDSPYIPSIEVIFYGECETNLFVNIKDFSKNNDSLLREIIISGNFSLLC